MNIVYLADHPHYVPTIGRWHYETWGHYDPSRTVDQRIERLLLHGKGSIPTTFVAILDSDEPEPGNQTDDLYTPIPVGCASLVIHDMSDRRDLSPWLAGVYVDPAYRHQEIGRALVQRVMQEARDLDVQRLYLYTPDRQTFYSHLGWQILERRFYHAREMAIMHFDFP